MVRLGLLRGVLDRGEHGVRDGLGVLLEKLGIEGEREELARGGDLDFHRAAAASDLELLGLELGLERLDAALHFLGLFEKGADAGHGLGGFEVRVAEELSATLRPPA